ncbi:uncharacterized protein LOC120701861 [Panicum virgatum]|uniref:uncharacterized protein LOC120701861 n=1 Tax=Panicum virgatum TaxID=38727 RepID=UPI0019D64E6B|nr:uncharacterized protein LOC120701861 [Panicum virgatum]
MPRGASGADARRGPCFPSHREPPHPRCSPPCSTAYRCASGPPCSTVSPSWGRSSGPVPRLHGTPRLLAAPPSSSSFGGGGLGFRRGSDAGVGVALLRSRIPPAASAHPAGASILQAPSHSPRDPQHFPLLSPQLHWCVFLVPLIQPSSVRRLPCLHWFARCQAVGRIAVAHPLLQRAAAGLLLQVVRRSFLPPCVAARENRYRRMSRIKNKCLMKKASLPYQSSTEPIVAFPKEHTLSADNHTGFSFTGDHTDPSRIDELAMSLLKILSDGIIYEIKHDTTPL